MPGWTDESNSSAGTQRNWSTVCRNCSRHSLSAWASRAPLFTFATWAIAGVHVGDAALYFHWRVAMLPTTLIEYIVAHEMVHQLERRHSAAFWERLERIIPDYRERSRWLAEHGAEYDL